MLQKSNPRIVFLGAIATSMVLVVAGIGHSEAKGQSLLVVEADSVATKMESEPVEFVRSIEYLSDPDENRGDQQTTSVAYSTDGKRLATGDPFGNILFRDRQEKTVLFAIRGQHEVAVRQLVFSPASDMLASVDIGGAVKFWSSEDGESIPRDCRGKALPPDVAKYSVRSHPVGGVKMVGKFGHRRISRKSFKVNCVQEP